MFTLNIECSRDIDEIHINFADGTSAVKSGKKIPGKPQARKSPAKPRNSLEDYSEKTSNVPSGGGFLDTDTDFSPGDKEVVTLPEIDRSDRPVKVAEELQNMDF